MAKTGHKCSGSFKELLYGSSIVDSGERAKMSDGVSQRPSFGYTEPVMTI